MKTKLKTATLALIVATTSALNAPTAHATVDAKRCIDMGRQRIVDIQSDHGFTAIGALLGGLNSFLGSQLLRAALLEAGVDGGLPLSRRVIETGSGLSSIGLGYLLFFGMADAGTQRNRDALRAFRQSEDYQCLVLELGRDRAEEFVADVLSDWEIEELAEKYLSAEDRRVLYRFRSENSRSSDDDDL